MPKYIVDGSDLTSVANAIRTAGGTSGSLSFPNGWNSAINAISGGGGGVEYEEGTWTPSADTDTTAISFTDTHTTAPAFALVQDIDNTTSSLASTDSVLAYFIVNFNGLFGSVPYATGSYLVGTSRYSYKTSSGQSMNGGQITATNTLDNYITASGITFHTGTTRYFRANHTYKWIAVWPPTT